MFRKLIEFYNKKRKDIPEPDYVNYEDPYIKEINNVKLKEETDNELLEKVS